MRLKAVSPEDLEFLYRLNTDPFIRAVSHNKGHFTFDQHCEYWKKKSQDPDFEAAIIIDNDTMVGCIRRDRGLISIAISPEFQNKGVGTEALKDFCKPGDKAEILTENRKSARCFEKAGFKWESAIWKR